MRKKENPNFSELPLHWLVVKERRTNNFASTSGREAEKRTTPPRHSSLLAPPPSVAQWRLARFNFLPCPAVQEREETPLATMKERRLCRGIARAKSYPLGCKQTKAVSWTIFFLTLKIYISAPRTPILDLFSELFFSH